MSHTTQYLNPLTGEVLSQEELEFLGSKAGKREVEFPNPTPMEPPIGFVRRPPIHLQIRDMVQAELSRLAQEAGGETFEESEDFDVDDDIFPVSAHENDLDPPATDDLPYDHPLRAAERRAALIPDDPDKMAAAKKARKAAAEPQEPDPKAPPAGARPEDAKP